MQTHRVVPSQMSGPGDAEAGIAATWHTAGEDNEKPRKRKKHSKDKSKDEEKADKSRDKEKNSAGARKSTKSSNNSNRETSSSLILLEDAAGVLTHSTGSTAVDNLLGIDMQDHAASATATTASSGSALPFATMPAPSSASDRIAAMFDSAEADKRQRAAAESAARLSQVPRESTSSRSRPQRESKDNRESNDTKEGKSKKEKKSSSSSSSGSGNFYLPAYSDDQLDVLYAVTCEDKGRGSSNSSNSYPLQVRWKVVNRSSDGSVISVAVMLQSPLLNVNPYSASYAPLATNLASSTDAKVAMELGMFNPVEEVLSIPCRLSLSVESLIGPEVRSVISEIRVTVCSTFSPDKLSEDGFAQALSKFTPGRWGSASAQVAVSGKPKSAFKALSGFLRAHIVEAEFSRAVSMAARTHSGGHVYILAKISSGGSKGAVQLDIKCACGSKQESDRAALLVVEALNGCSL